MKKKFSIIRTAVGSTVVAGFIRELQKHGVRVIGVDPDPNAVGRHLCDAFYTAPWGKNKEFIHRMLNICKKERDVRTIISGPEEEVRALARSREAFTKLGVRIFVSSERRVLRMTDKKTFSMDLQACGYMVPALYTSVRALKIPFIVKPRRGRGSSGIRIVRARADKDTKLDPRMLYQAYIDGTEYSVDCFFDENHEPLLLVPRIRIKTDSGVSIISTTVHHNDIEREVAELGKKLSLIGPHCIQLIESKNKRYYIDGNNRFGGASILSIQASAGFMPTFLALCDSKPYTRNMTFIEGLTMKRFYEEIYEKTH